MPIRTENASPAVDARGICRRYLRRWALVGVDLRIEQGRLVMLAGRNGSGKSTLLRVLATAIRADRGSAQVLGHDLRTEPEAARRATAFLSHQSYLYEALTARENLDVAARFLAAGGREAALRLVAASKARLLLDEVGLADRADDPVSSFSAGMRKRLSLARILLQEADLVLLDEPYAALDGEGVALVDRQVTAMKARGATVIMATHRLEHGGGLCDEAVQLEEGRLVWRGLPSDLPLRPPAGGATA